MLLILLLYFPICDGENILSWSLVFFLYSKSFFFILPPSILSSVYFIIRSRPSVPTNSETLTLTSSPFIYLSNRSLGYTIFKA